MLVVACVILWRLRNSLVGGRRFSALVRLLLSHRRVILLGTYVQVKIAAASISYRFWYVDMVNGRILPSKTRADPKIDRGSAHAFCGSRCQTALGECS